MLSLGSLADVIFQWSKAQKIIIAIALFFIVLSIIYYKYRNYFEKILLKASQTHKTIKKYLNYSPFVLHDIENGKVHAEKNHAFKEFYGHWLKKIYDEDRSFFNIKDKKYIFLKNYGYRWILLFMFVLLSVIFNMSFGISNLRIIDYSFSNIISEEEIIINPKRGFFFYGQPLTINIKIKNNKYDFLGIELKKGGVYYPQKEWKIHRKAGEKEYDIINEFLSENITFRAVFIRGIERFYSDSYEIRISYPSSFKSVEFLIDPPKYTGLGAYKENKNIFRVYYGSLIKAKIKTNGTAKISLQNKELRPVRRDENISEFEYSMIYNSKEPRQIQFYLESENKNKEENIRQKSPVYEVFPIEDLKPSVKILGNTPDNMKIQIPEKSVLSFKYEITEDFGLKEVFIVFLKDNKTIRKTKIPLTKAPVVENNLKTWRNSAQISLSGVKEKNYMIYLCATDNSQIPDKYFWEKNFGIGQKSISMPIEIMIPENEITEENWDNKLQSEMVSELETIITKYQESENELPALIESLQNKDENVQKEEIKKWINKRDSIKEELKEYKNRMNTNILPDTERQTLEKKETENEMKSVLDEEISRKEKELMKLMKNFSENFVEAQESIKSISKREYLDSLNNSLERLKKLLTLKKLSRLQNLLDKQIEKFNSMQKKIIYDDKRNSKKIIKETEERKKDYNEIKNIAKEYLEEVRKELQKDILPSKALDEKWEIHAKKAVENISIENYTESLKSLGQMTSVIEEWKNNITNIAKDLGLDDLKKVVQLNYRTAFKINEVSKVIEELSDEKLNQANNLKENVKDFGLDASLLKNSYLDAFSNYLDEMKKQGMIKAQTVAKLTQPVFYLDKIIESAESGLVLSVKNYKKSLLWKLNLASLELLKEMGQMRMTMAKIGQGRRQNEMNKAGSGQRKIMEELQKLGENEAKKSEALNSAENAYLNNLKMRQENIKKQLEKILAEKEIEDSSEKKEIESLLNQINEMKEDLFKIKDKSDLKKFSRKYEKEKFIRYKKSIQNKDEFSNQREAEKPFEYQIKAPPENILPKKNKAVIMSAEEGFSEIQRLFFRNYIENLEKQD